MIPMRANAHINDDFEFAFGMMARFLIMSYFLPLYRLAYRIGNEKETRARESMKMMGLGDTAYWLSWFTYFMIYVTIISLISTLLLHGGVVVNTSFGTFFLWIWLFGLSNFGLVLMILPFCDSSSSAGKVTVFLYYFLSYLVFLVFNENVGAVPKNIISIISPSAAMYLGSDNF